MPKKAIKNSIKAFYIPMMKKKNKIKNTKIIIMCKNSSIPRILLIHPIDNNK